MEEFALTRGGKWDDLNNHNGFEGPKANKSRIHDQEFPRNNAYHQSNKEYEVLLDLEIYSRRGNWK